MIKTTLSSKGQLIIPKPIRNARHWEEGQELLLIDCAEGLILKPVINFEKTTLREVGGSLKYNGHTKSLKDMEKAIKKGAQAQRHDLG